MTLAELAGLIPDATLIDDHIETWCRECCGVLRIVHSRASGLGFLCQAGCPAPVSEAALLAQAPELRQAFEEAETEKPRRGEGGAPDRVDDNYNPRTSNENRSSAGAGRQGGTQEFTIENDIAPPVLPDGWGGESRTEQLRIWKTRIAHLTYELIKADPEYHKPYLTFEQVLEPLRNEVFAAVRSALFNTAHAVYRQPEWLDDDEAWVIVGNGCETAWGLFRERDRNDLLIQNGVPALAAARVSAIVVENAEQAIVSNDEYLKRPALLEQLYYTHHSSLHVGGKHEGKTTATKTEALAFAVGGITVYGRQVAQTPVIYAASEDEYPSARMDLIRMGWNPGVPLQMVKMADDGDPEFVLEDIAKAALSIGARFVVLDMLFDFTQIHDEIKYAHTRDATKPVIQLAVAIDGHVKATHHSPKWMPDAATAAKAALGSQGLAARFSPILLSKQWADGLYTVESTTTRDPRGKPLPLLCVEKDEGGWLRSTGEFKSWMKWKIYAKRIHDYFEMQEPGARCTVAKVSRELELPRPEAQNTMLRMAQGPNAVLERMKFKGNAYTYALIGRSSFADLNAEFKMESVQIDAKGRESVDVKTPSTNSIKNVAPEGSRYVRDPEREEMEKRMRQRRKEEADKYGIPFKD